jgi:small subunit ribosomal protein S6
MAAPAPEYELVLMLDPETPDERRDEISADARQRIESGGVLKHDNVWGMRKMAFEINTRTEADYRFFRFETGGSLLDDLNHNLRIADGVLRFRIFKVDPDAPVIVPPAATAAPGPRERSAGGREDYAEAAGDSPAEESSGPAEAEPAPSAAEETAAAPSTEAAPEPASSTEPAPSTEAAPEPAPSTEAEAAPAPGSTEPEAEPAASPDADE